MCIRDSLNSALLTAFVLIDDIFNWLWEFRLPESIRIRHFEGSSIDPGFKVKPQPYICMEPSSEEKLAILPLIDKFHDIFILPWNTGINPSFEFPVLIEPVIDTLRSLIISIGESLTAANPAYLKIDSEFLFSADIWKEVHWENRIDPVEIKLYIV